MDNKIENTYQLEHLLRRSKFTRRQLIWIVTHIKSKHRTTTSSEIINTPELKEMIHRFLIAEPREIINVNISLEVRLLEETSLSWILEDEIQHNWINNQIHSPQTRTKKAPPNLIGIAPSKITSRELSIVQIDAWEIELSIKKEIINSLRDLWNSTKNPYHHLNWARDGDEAYICKSIWEWINTNSLIKPPPITLNTLNEVISFGGCRS